ncbi:MAG: DUF1330 domain-containing protein [Pseudomonadota bacterium]
MEVNNSLYPNEAQMAGFGDGEQDGPIYMVNLLKFREQAQYADGRETQLSGREAYGLYSAGVTQLLAEVGGSITFGAQVSRLTIGEVEELWDMVAIAMYPSRAAMFEMMSKPAMAEIAEHRQAGLVGQLNIETVDAVGV